MFRLQSQICVLERVRLADPVRRRVMSRRRCAALKRWFERGLAVNQARGAAWLRRQMLSF